MSDLLYDAQLEVPYLTSRWSMNDAAGSQYAYDDVGGLQMIVVGSPSFQQQGMQRGDTRASAAGGYTAQQNYFSQTISPAYQLGAGVTLEGITCAEPGGNTFYVFNGPGQAALAVLGTQLGFSVGIPALNLTNLALNPSFEADALSAAPAWWSKNSTGITSTFAVQNGWASQGSQSCRCTAASTGSNQFPGWVSPSATSGIPVTPGQVVSCQVTANILTNTTTNTPSLVLRFYNSSGTWLGGGTDATAHPGSTTGVLTWSVSNFTVPASAAYMSIIVFVNTTASGQNFDGYLDGVIATLTTAVQPYFDGDSLWCYWTGTRGNSTSVKQPSVLTPASTLKGYPQLVHGVYDPVAATMGAWVDGSLVTSVGASGSPSTSMVGSSSLLKPFASVVTSAAGEDIAVYSGPLSQNRIAHNFAAFRQQLPDPLHSRMYPQIGVYS